MTETSSKNSSSWAITEKRPQRSSSCVGVFFQLFDWNRRLAKKKLFSKKLFPPVPGAKRVSSKFGSDEKLPTAKLLIADENRGGFPSMKRTGNDSDVEGNRMITPGLVARLMGLESMPVVHRDKPKKAPVLDFYSNQETQHGEHAHDIEKASGFCYDRDLNSEKGLMKVDLRPQKLQKTGFFDRRMVTKVGAEALQFKNVLPRSRKQHHRLATPVKSPRSFAGKNAVRLMGAATKLLEPGVQATNRARCSLTYSNSHISQDDHTYIEGTAFSLKQKRQPTGPSGAKFLNAQSTCNSCGNFIAAVDFIPNAEVQVTDFASSASEITSSEFSNASSHGSGNSMKSPKTSPQQDDDADGGRSVFPKCHAVASPAAQAKANVQKRTQNFMDRKPHIQRDRNLLPVTGECKPQLVIDSNPSKQNNQRGNQIMPAKNRSHERAKLSSHEIRRDLSFSFFNRNNDRAPSNRNLSHPTRAWTLERVLDDSKIKMAESSWEKKDDSLSTGKTMVRKRRPVNSSPQVESTGFVNSNLVKQRSVSSDVSHRNGSAPFRSVNRSGGKTAFQKKAEGNDARNSKDADGVSFTFTSKKKHDSSSSSSVKMKKKQNKSEVTCESSCKEEVMLCGKNESSSHLRVNGLKEDALGALLQQKLRELTCLERDESSTGDNLSGRSTAILQELISALSMSRPTSQENGDNCSDGLSSKDSLYSNSPVCSDCTRTHVQEMVHSPGSKLKTELKEGFSLQYYPLAADCDHPSPTSILEASFSNDSCLSESPSYSSGHKLDNQWGYSHCKMQPQLRDPDLLDSATSINSRKLRKTFTNISSMLASDTDEIRLTAVKLNYARDVVLDAELLFENLARYDVDATGADTIVDTLFLDKLEDHLSGSSRYGLGLTEVERKQLRGFLFDCMVESLDSRYSCYFKSGFREWSKLPLSLSRGRLAVEIYDDIRKWRTLAEKDLDSMVEKDMSNSMGKWTDFKPEVFDMGVEIESNILQILLNDMVMDLSQCSGGS